jgi:transposase-like protein
MRSIPNYHARGNTQPHSIIDKYGVGSVVLELYARGHSYREISNAIWEKHSVKVSKMAISRYVARDRMDIRPNTVHTSLQTIREATIQRTVDTYEDFNRVFDEIKTLIDTSKLPSTDKLSIHKNLDAKQKQILNEFTENRAEIGLIFEAIQKNEKGVMEVLLEFSRSMCPECRRKVVETIKIYESNT